ncbi:GntR family transcriptional regulator [Actinomadura sp. 1N219]|uniref:GntR family transcriptional regulator n=1 Tax=Actinomadura sp. 1N219 TaxID=3375152 RepID=UPI0037A05F84
MTPAARSAGSASDRAHDAILTNLRDGVYLAGERLTESRLTDEIGVSRVPLREALKRLDAEGVLDLHPHRGAVVRVLERRDIAEFFQVRILLEGFASRLAAQRIHEDDNLDFFSGLLDLTQRAASGDEAAEFQTQNDLVHGGVVRRSGNRLLVRQWETMQLPLHRLRHFASSSTRSYDASTDDHAQILRAVVVGDGPEAQARMEAHLRHVVGTVMELNRTEFDNVFNPGLH